MVELMSPPWSTTIRLLIFCLKKTLPPRSTAFICLWLDQFQVEVNEEGVCLTLVASRHVESSDTFSTLPPTCVSLLEEFSDVLVDLPSGLSLKCTIQH